MAQPTPRRLSKRKLKRPYEHTKDQDVETADKGVQEATEKTEPVASDEDDVPLLQRRSFFRKRRRQLFAEEEAEEILNEDENRVQLTKTEDMSDILPVIQTETVVMDDIPPTPEPNVVISSRLKNLASTLLKSTENKELSLKQISIPKESEPLIQKLSQCMNTLCSDSIAQEDREDEQMLPLSVLHQFTLLVAKSAQSKCLQGIDHHQFEKIISRMEYAVAQVIETDIIEEYSKARIATPLSSVLMPSMMNLLEKIAYAMQVSVMLLDILAACKMAKQAISKGILSTCLRYVKNQLDTSIYPLIDLTHFDEDPTSLNNELRTFLALVEVSSAKQHLASLLPLITRFLQRAHILLQQEAVEDHSILMLSYISMGSFFHDYTENNTSCLVRTRADATINPYERMKYSALDMLTTLFGNHPHHRRWIMDEILTGLGSLTTMDRTVKHYRLSSGQSLHVTSALWIQLVQSCCVPINLMADKGWLRKWELKHQKYQNDENTKQLRDLEEKLVLKATEGWKEGMEAAVQTASYFLQFLMAKCRSRQKSTYSIAEYRMILQGTLEDILIVLNDPMWPGSELILHTFTKLLVAVIESESPDSYLKSLAIKWLGIIACTIKTGYTGLSGENEALTPEWLYQLNNSLPMEINYESSLDDIELFFQCQMRLYHHIDRCSTDLNLVQFCLSVWGHTHTLLWSRSQQENIDHDDQEQEIQTSPWPEDTVAALRSSIKHYWLLSLGIDNEKRIPAVAFEFPELNRTDMKLLSKLLASRQPLYRSYPHILSQIMSCLDHDSVSFRTKALKSLGSIAKKIPEVLDEARILNPIIKRIHDPSPSVRDSAVEVIAKYLCRQETISMSLYKVVSGRILDTAMNVRKRLVKLLSELYSQCDDRAIKVNIAAKLIQRVSDNEISISELSLKVTQEILFHPFRLIEKDGNDAFGSSYQYAPKERKQNITQLALLITEAVAEFDTSVPHQNQALAQIVQKTIDGCDSKLCAWYEKIFQWIVDALFEQMLLFDEQEDTARFLYCLTTVYAFAKVCPNILRETHISMLEPYLNTIEENDWSTVHYVLMIYRDVVPRQKYHDPDFVRQLEQTLQQLITQCPLDVISSAISCLCAIVEMISKRYNVLIKLLGSCIVKLQQDKTQIEKENKFIRSAAVIRKMLSITGLLCQYFDFDAMKALEPVKMKAIERIHKDNISLVALDLLYFFANSLDTSASFMQIKATALQSLGYLYAAHPTFMIKKQSIQLMNELFECDSIAMKVQLMRVFLEFLSAEEKRLDKQERDAGTSLYTKIIDIETLLGNTEEFSELGVNGSLMQLYLGRILTCALEKTSDLRYAAFDVVAAIINQGLAHPVLCMPVIVATETSPDMILRDQAYYLHKFAHDKYGLLLYSGFSEYMTTAFEYQKCIYGGNVKGYGNGSGDAKLDSLFASTYNVLKEKRKIKLDFLSALIKPFAFDMETKSEQINTEFLKFLADAILTLQFTQSEEVVSILYHLDRILMTLGADVLESIQSFRKQGLLSERSEEYEYALFEATEKDKLDPDYAISAKIAIAMCILLYIREFLMDIYAITNGDIQDYNSITKPKSGPVSRSEDKEQLVDWTEITYFRQNKLDNASAKDACIRFEAMMMKSAGMESRDI
ncbi:sister chromatid cohesion C-terminus-domain-containing protein [Spinellus fusiger]|nr:sister chromatid cohesion C-terminus-domain-containing protein [Spinellus fusiger]